MKGLREYLDEATADRMFNKSFSTSSAMSIEDHHAEPSGIQEPEEEQEQEQEDNEDDTDSNSASYIDRIAKLAGIKETTCSGNIASAPSVVGDTSDSHKPTVQLRKDNRLKKEISDEKEGKKKPKRVTANTSQIFRRIDPSPFSQ